MQLPQIRLQSQMAKIQIQQTPARQEIRQPKADLSIEQPKADLTMKTKPAKLNIDQTQAWEDMNRMHVSKLIKKFANEGQQALLEGIGRRAEQGAQLMKIENKGNPIPQQAIANAFDGMKTLGIKFIPSQFSVHLDYQPAEVDIDVKPNKPIIDAKINKPTHQYERGSVNINMKQYQNLDIDFVHLFPES
ncbi:DUF6470 family protein [Lentibacillus sp. Marseille-P4043]|uniref:DUF6470 family protein n=1 Tax=Lentibacillus sp. Marseille-P4043 TaxID=2040293 RepID=UPI000D0ACCD1|nr:DUF6470 family protein [Lentibacillus sp. Marseille-P4043]